MPIISDLDKQELQIALRCSLGCLISHSATSKGSSRPKIVELAESEALRHC
ncbi:uncharacterized protein RCC_03834 [Ramularia collo-cygni]|uniref:Uncharacterized protein n=1 Tax=Ramularia collo-cygni TaxID=112498 RepID=A0A2D3V381_9PEZI|nr:uncharacterized protein RCC_03834 [Ramularia collo-cygni]CZT17996.1 uncharacterized protein RCC_03834 [Ramularia collo-cygni]